MQDALQACLPAWHIERATDHATTLPSFRAPCPCGEARRAFPLGVIGSRRDDRDFVTARPEPGGHLPRILADAREFWREIESDDEKTHVRVLRAGADQERPDSISVLSRQDHPYGHQEDLEVKPWRPVVDVPEIVIDPFSSFLRSIDLTAQPMHLGPSGDAWPHTVAQKISSNRLVIDPIACLHLHDVRTWPNERHVAKKDVEELRQFVDAQAA